MDDAFSEPNASTRRRSFLDDGSEDDDDGSLDDLFFETDHFTHVPGSSSFQPDWKSKQQVQKRKWEDMECAYPISDNFFLQKQQQTAEVAYVMKSSYVMKSPTEDKDEKEEKETGLAGEPGEGSEQEIKEKDVMMQEMSSSIEGVQCSICYNVYNTPVKLTSCTHIFCSGCITKAWIATKSCPICRSESAHGDLEYEPVQLKHDDLRVKCAHRDNGCDELSLPEKYHEHIQNCPYEIVMCKFEDCGCPWSGIRKDKECHEDKCIMNEMGGIGLSYMMRIDYTRCVLNKAIESIAQLRRDQSEMEWSRIHQYVKDDMLRNQMMQNVQITKLQREKIAQMNKVEKLIRQDESLSVKLKDLSEMISLFTPESASPTSEKRILLNVLTFGDETMNRASIRVIVDDDTTMLTIMNYITQMVKCPLFITLDGPLQYGGTPVDPRSTVKELGLHNTNRVSIYAERIQFGTGNESNSFCHFDNTLIMRHTDMSSNNERITRPLASTRKPHVTDEVIANMPQNYYKGITQIPYAKRSRPFPRLGMLTPYQSSLEDNFLSTLEQSTMTSPSRQGSGNS